MDTWEQESNTYLQLIKDGLKLGRKYDQGIPIYFAGILISRPDELPPRVTKKLVDSLAAFYVLFFEKSRNASKMQR